MKIILNRHRPKTDLVIKYFITLACNNRCSYCFMLPELNNNLKFNPSTFESFKLKLNEIDSNHNIRLEILGGDPLFINEIFKINELTHPNLNIVIYSNCNIEPTKFRRIVSNLKDNCRIITSVHLTSNLDYVKDNILHLDSINKLEEIIYILEEKSLSRVDEFIKFFEDNNLNYILDLVREKGVIIEDPKAKEVFLKHYKNSISNYRINDTFFTEDEILKYDLYNIPYYFNIKCFTNEISVDYYGGISMNCNHEYTSHISKGFKVLPLFCKNKNCDCAYAQYKEIISPKLKPSKKEKEVIDFVLSKGVI